MKITTLNEEKVTLNTFTPEYVLMRSVKYGTPSECAMIAEVLSDSLQGYVDSTLITYIQPISSSSLRGYNVKITTKFTTMIYDDDIGEIRICQLPGGEDIVILDSHVDTPFEHNQIVFFDKNKQNSVIKFFEDIQEYEF